jgi:hypothetical protein
MTTVLEAAMEYTKRGWAVLPFKSGMKGPGGAEAKGWRSWRFTPDELPEAFTSGTNIGVMMGLPSGGLIDIDLDTTQAGFLAPRFLPPTPAVFGRASKEESHWLYLVTASPTSGQPETPAPD